MKTRNSLKKDLEHNSFGEDAEDEYNRQQEQEADARQAFYEEWVGGLQ